MRNAITVLLIAVFFSGCGKLSQPITQQGVSTPSNSAAILTPADSASTFRHFSVIREFGGNDTAALFGVIPNEGELQITSVSGPTFLGGYRIGQLNQESIKHLFVNTSKPLSQTERDSLVSQYSGSQVIYFEKYNGNLCAGPDSIVKISILGTLGGRKVTLIFHFSATPQATGSCKFLQLFLETRI